MTSHQRTRLSSAGFLVEEDDGLTTIRFGADVAGLEGGTDGTPHWDMLIGRVHRNPGSGPLRGLDAMWAAFVDPTEIGEC